MKPGWMALPDRSFLGLKGPDAVRFLNGQVSNDVDRDLSSIVVPACLCSLKGKVEALIWVTQGLADDGLLIDVETAQADFVYQRLDRYLIADDCELEERNDIELVHVISDSIPEGGRESWRFGVRGVDLYTGSGVPDWEQLSDEEVLRSKVAHGIPDSENEISGEEFPSELGLDTWAVDFHKGCYLGQEIVSRLESVGKAKHRSALYRTKDCYERGHCFRNAEDREMGRVIRNSVPDGEGTFFTLVFEKSPIEETGFQEIEIERPPRI